MSRVASPPTLQRYAWLSIAAALVTIALKTAAWLLTGSVGLLSDALESLVNLAAALLALAMLIVAHRPPDEEHAFGHEKAEYFASGVEGSLIVVAAAGIAVTAVQRLLHPRPLADVPLGLAVSMVAAGVNFVVARILLQAGHRHGSITLEADARHLLTDVWTSIGVVVGVGLVAATGFLALDPMVALAVAAQIVWTGVQLVRRSTLGLLDTALPRPERDRVDTVLQRFAATGVAFHSVRTRRAGRRRFVSMHVLVPGEWTVQSGHELLERLEREVRTAFDGPTTVFTHLEPLEDPASMNDMEIDRND